MNDNYSNLQYFNANERFNPGRKAVPKIDEMVSKVVGKKIFAQDPRLIKLVVKWKNGKGESDKPDNFLKSPSKIKELKEALA